MKRSCRIYLTKHKIKRIYVIHVCVCVCACVFMLYSVECCNSNLSTVFFPFRSPSFHSIRLCISNVLLHKVTAMVQQLAFIFSIRMQIVIFGLFNSSNAVVLAEIRTGQLNAMQSWLGIDQLTIMEKFCLSN